MKLYCESCKKKFTIVPEEAQTETACTHCGAAVAVPAEKVGPGVVLGDFQIKNLIAKGGMGEVYLARQLSLDRDVALKVLQNKHSDDKDYVDSLYREARAAAKINHPNVVQAYAVGEEEGTFYFAMELVRGDTFKEILKARGGKLEFKEAAKVIRDISRALSVAWKEQKLVHQDIKPDNIMLDSSGFAKLADLGLAKNSTSNQSNDDSDEVLGTPQYISPEQLTGVPTDVRSDIYSLGATFYQFVTGRYAYMAENINDLPRLHVEGNLEPPKNVNPELPDALNDIIVKMMARQPENRYQTPDTLITDLENYMRSADAPAPDPQPQTPGALRLGKPTVSPGGVPQMRLGAPKAAGAAPRPIPGMGKPGAKPAVPGAKPGLSLNKQPGAPAMAAKPAAAKPAVPAAAPAAAKAAPPAAPSAAKPAATPAATPAVPKPAATPAVPKPVAAPAVPKPVATPAVPKPVATPAAPAPVAAPKPVAAPVAVKPAVDNKQPGVKPPVTDAPQGKGGEATEEKPTSLAGKIVKSFFLVIGILLILIIAFVVTVVILKKMNKLPKFLSRTERFMSDAAEKAKDKAVELSKAPDTVIVIGEDKIVTRPEYLQKVDELIQLSKSDVSGKTLFPQLDAAYPMLRAPRTPEETEAFERLMTTICATDEELRCVPSRNELRAKYRKKLIAARENIRKQKAEEERRIRLQRQQEEEAKKKSAELEAQRAESAKVAIERLEEFKKNTITEGSNVAEAALKSVIQNKPELFVDAKAAADNYIKYAICETLEEKALLDRLQTFIKLLPAELKKLNVYKQRLSVLSSRHNLYITLEDNAMALVQSIRPGTITCELDDGSKRTLMISDLEERPRTIFCNGLSKRFKQLPNAAFYIPLFDMYVDDIAFKAIPNGFWKTYWEFVAPVVKK